MKTPLRTSVTARTPKTPRPAAKATSSTPARPRSTRKPRLSAPRAAEPIVETPMSPSEEAIRQRAYEIYRGRQADGDAISDWLQAEQELVARAS